MLHSLQTLRATYDASCGILSTVHSHINLHDLQNKRHILYSRKFGNLKISVTRNFDYEIVNWIMLREIGLSDRY